MKAQQPAEGILIRKDYGDAKSYTDRRGDKSR